MDLYTGGNPLITQEIVYKKASMHRATSTRFILVQLPHQEDRGKRKASGKSNLKDCLRYHNLNDYLGRCNDVLTDDDMKFSVYFLMYIL